jgi:hypothetical protein
LSVLQNRMCDVSLAYCCYMSKSYSIVLQICLKFFSIYLCEQLFCSIYLCEQLFCSIYLCEQLFCSIYLCEQLFSLVKRKKIFRISWTADANNESSKNTNVKFEINKLSTNKWCHFLEIIVPINETSEQKQDGYCNVDFVFMFGSNKCLLYLWHHGTLYYH